jgi:tetratricopeptide (TPR) repeat protein
LYMLTGKYDKAKPWINKALGTDPADEVLKQCLAAAEKGELPSELRKQIEPVPVVQDDSPASKLAMEGWKHFNSGKTRSAERSFRQALAKDPENLPAMNGLGFLLVNTGKTAEAKALFEKYLEKEPDAAGPMNGLARCLKAEGKADEAIALWEKMVKQNPGVNAGTVGLATTFAERKEYDKALPYLEELVKAQPESPEYKQLLAEAQKATKAK